MFLLKIQIDLIELLCLVLWDMSQPEFKDLPSSLILPQLYLKFAKLKEIFLVNGLKT